MFTMHIISIYPAYVNAILDGRKTFECRKSSIGLRPGDMLALYATSPTKAILGQARVLALHRDTPAALWDKFRQFTAVTEVDYFSYYATSQEAVLIELENIVRLDSPISLSALRETEPRFSPPQTARKLSDALQSRLPN